MMAKKYIFILVGIVILGLYVYFNSSKQPTIEISYKKLNISCFVYRDINRNGLYDIADRPYAGLAVEMKPPSGSDIISRSNISGFSNFKMSLNNETYPVHTAGTYNIKVIPAKGWLVSSSNDAQVLNFKELKGSPAGLIADQTCAPIGVMPILEIKGSVKVSDFDSNNSIQSFIAISPTGQTMPIKLDQKGEYTLPVINGEWVLSIETIKAKLSRHIMVNNYSVVVSQINTGLSFEEIKLIDQKIVNFDALTSSDTLYEIPNGYEQLNWTNWIATHQKYYKGYGYINGTISSEYMAYNSSGHPAEVWSDQPFNFKGVYLSVAWRKAKLKKIVIKAWQGNELVYEDTLNASNAGAIYFDADYKNITKISFSTETYWQIIMDDFSYQKTN